MRKALLLLAFLMPLLASSAQESMVKVGTGLSYGKQFTLSAEPVDGDSIIVDYGDGTKVNLASDFTATWNNTQISVAQLKANS